VLLYQRLTFYFINGVVLAWLFKVMVTDESSDAVGLLTLLVMIVLALYAFYFTCIVHYSHRWEPEDSAGKVKFLLLALWPFLALSGFLAYYSLIGRSI
jgi:ABC-type multidrug transport system permease subunit